MKRYYLTNEKSKQVLHAWFPTRKELPCATSFTIEDDPYLYMFGVPLCCNKTAPNKLDYAIEKADAQQISYGTYMLKTYWSECL